MQCHGFPLLGCTLLINLLGPTNMNNSITTNINKKYTRRTLDALVC